MMYTGALRGAKALGIRYRHGVCFPPQHHLKCLTLVARIPIAIHSAFEDTGSTYQQILSAAQLPDLDIIISSVKFNYGAVARKTKRDVIVRLVQLSFELHRH